MGRAEPNGARRPRRNIYRRSWTVGAAQVLAISDYAGILPFPLDRFFPEVSPRDWEPFRQRYPGTFVNENTLFQNVTCLLIRSEGRWIIVDTGIGPAGAPMGDFLLASGRLLGEMAAAGIRPEDIDTVINTCLHPDHTGWNVRIDGAAVRPTFPRARYLVDQADWQEFQKSDVQAALPFPYVNEVIRPLERLGVIEWTKGDHPVTGEVSILGTPGHSPGNRCVVIDSRGEKAIFWGDTFLHPAQITEPGWSFIYDLDPEQATRTRRTLVARLEAERMRTYACHFEQPGAGVVVRQAGGLYYWQAS